ncbi:hypothetical protein HDF24_07375 [Mucilaginibacter sp. X4EP1]|uniref:hypothetical protein n=1 Tax=Mucilaginibacter sp. X4EP1 TaxID=2723092 RepID=UPI002169D8AA|nr:hypothetical protein [Mucilaginibacter sp. X4EP1]MCS3814131.1 HEPN domain-containing protein [Mucilaginibacter sp. X4EP1]
MKSFDQYVRDNYSHEEIQLANEIAERLNNPSSLAQFLRYTKEVPHYLLEEYLDAACVIPAHKVHKSRAAIFVNSVNNYKHYGHGDSGN